MRLDADNKHAVKLTIVALILSWLAYNLYNSPFETLFRGSFNWWWLTIRDDLFDGIILYLFFITLPIIAAIAAYKMFETLFRKGVLQSYKKSGWLMVWVLRLYIATCLTLISLLSIRVYLLM